MPKIPRLNGFETQHCDNYRKLEVRSIRKLKMTNRPSFEVIAMLSFNINISLSNEDKLMAYMEMSLHILYCSHLSHAPFFIFFIYHLSHSPFTLSYANCNSKEILNITVAIDTFMILNLSRM
jgi:hypothetical protein